MVSRVKHKLAQLKHLFEFILLPFKSQKGFIYQGKYYPYFYSMYNATWRGERQIEIPIFRDILKEYDGKDILEIGNVMSYYVQHNHLVIDKYEKADGVKNISIINFKPRRKYDLIFSISTFEHIGIDYNTLKKDNENAIAALKYTQRLLKEDGLLVISFPHHKNLPLTEYVLKNQFETVIFNYKHNKDKVVIAKWRNKNNKSL